MNNWYGNIVDNDTIYMTFNTFNSSGASVTATIVDGDIEVYKDGGLTQLATNGATVQKDFDTVAGAHQITINTAASGDYAIGSDYSVRVEGISVDSQTINAFIGSFSIQNRFMRGTDSAALATTLNNKVPNNLNTTVTGNIGIDWANVENPTTALDLSQTDIQLVDTCTTNTDKNTLAATDIVSAGAITTLAGAVVNVDLVDTTTTNTDKNTLAATDIVSAGAITTLTGAVVNVDTVDTVTGGATEDKQDDAQTDLDTITDTGVNMVSTSANAITETSIATDAIDADALAADAVNLILDEEVDNDGDAISLRGAQKLMLSVLTGVSSGGGSTTLTFKKLVDGTTTRISATADGNGNRTAVGTRDAT